MKLAEGEGQGLQKLSIKMRAIYILSVFSLSVSCAPDREDFKAHCLANVEVQIFDEDKWNKFMISSISHNGQFLKRPVKFEYDNGEYLRFIISASEDGIKCRLAGQTDKLPPCDDSKIHKSYSLITFYHYRPKSDGENELISTSEFARVRNDYHTDRRVIHHVRYCYDRFYEDYILGLKENSDV